LDYKKKTYPGVPETIDYQAIYQEERPFADRLAIWIKDKINPTKVLDLGCGPGIYVWTLKDVGVDVKGVDIDPRVDGLDLIEQGDLLSLDGVDADLVVCMEVAEHIDPQYSNDIVNSVYKSIEDGGILLWTAAQPGQGGVGHINCRTKEYWLQKFIKAGLTYDDVLTGDLIDYCKQGVHMGWFVNNVMILRKDL